MVRGSDKYQILLHTVTAIVVFLGFSGCELIDPNPGPAPIDDRQQVDNSTPSIAKGEALFVANCERCHGESGDGALIWPAPIWRVEDPGVVIRNGRDAMPPFPAISDSQIVSIGLYLASAGPPPTTEPGANFSAFCEGCHGAFGAGGSFFPSSIQGYTAVADVVRSGRGEMPALAESQLSPEALDSLSAFVGGLANMTAYSGEEYFAARCAGCHGFSAEGTDRGYPIAHPSAEYAGWVIRQGRPGTQFPNTMPAFEEVHLTSDQLDELLMYLASLPRPDSGPELYRTYCGNCHGGDGGGGVTGSSLSEALTDTTAFLSGVRQGFGGSNYADRARYMPAWDSGQITDAEVRAIRTYLQSLTSG